MVLKSLLLSEDLFGWLFSRSNSIINVFSTFGFLSARFFFGKRRKIIDIIINYFQVKILPFFNIS